MLKINSFPANFSHIYVEEKALEYKMTSDVLSRFKEANVIPIKHYKDVFNRTSQDACLQNRSKSLILAVNDGRKIFDASPVCQDFDMGKFYYAESAMNCVFSCDYCFLKGMYATSNVVIFVNSDDYLKECDRLREDGPLYLCASFDTDLGALSHICPWKNIWEDYVSAHEDMTVELRTKSVINDFRISGNIIYAFTLSPQQVIDKFEKQTPSLDARIKCINSAIDQGAVVRLCFDPLVYVKDFELCYNEFTDTILRSIDLDRVKDIGIGTFRISSDYLGNLKKASPGSAAVLFPFDREDGFCVYPKELREKMTGTVINKLKRAGYGNKIFV